MSEELISRSAALTAIFACICRHPLDVSIRPAYEEALEAIGRLPAADVMPVVRCATCEYVRPSINAHTGEQVGIWCSLHDIINVSPDDYCSRGEKKGGDGHAAD